ncbi:hypothetical protein TURU_115036 [Turdus rufiventris]|nr:hypothetical protein TURU_115036 [Turdus rufiventris]
MATLGLFQWLNPSLVTSAPIGAITEAGLWDWLWGQLWDGGRVSTACVDNGSTRGQEDLIDFVSLPYNPLSDKQNISQSQLRIVSQRMSEELMHLSFMSAYFMNLFGDVLEKLIQDALMLRASLEDIPYEIKDDN